jgi:hypothetical protein
LKLPERIDALVSLGVSLKSCLQDADPDTLAPDCPAEELFRSGECIDLAVQTGAENPWFTPYSIYHALSETCHTLEREELLEWISRYDEQELEDHPVREIGTILAGNVPLVGFHDFLSILISGHSFRGKLSGKDDKLLPFLADKLVCHEPSFGDRISFDAEKLGSFDAIIATGSNNTSRYFNYYFGRYPHLFRKNRNGVAVLTGKESAEELALLAEDIFLYFGLGCRNVAKLYVPEGYEFTHFFPAMERFEVLRDHAKYANNYTYRRSVFLLNQAAHLDNGFLLLCPDRAFSSPAAVLHYETCPDLAAVENQLAACREQIQCVVSSAPLSTPSIPFGRSQHPRPWEYADNVDTLKFLTNLS